MIGRTAKKSFWIFERIFIDFSLFWEGPRDNEVRIKFFLFPRFLLIMIIIGKDMIDMLFFIIRYEFKLKDLLRLHISCAYIFK